MDEQLGPEGFDEESAWAAAMADLTAQRWGQAEARLRTFGLASARCRDALVAMVEVLIALKRPAEALQCAIQAIGLEDGPEARVALAKTHLALREWADAEAASRSALALDPDHGGAHLSLGQALVARRLWAQALVAMEAACRLLPQALPAHLGAAQVAWALEDRPGAQEALGRALALAPADPEALRLATAWGLTLPGQSPPSPPPPRPAQSPSGHLGRPSAASAHQAALARLQAKLRLGAQAAPEASPPSG